MFTDLRAHGSELAEFAAAADRLGVMSILNGVWGRDHAAVSRFAVSGPAFAIGAFAIEFLAITLLGVLTGAGYHLGIYNFTFGGGDYLNVSGLIALLYCAVFLIGDEYSIENLIEGRRGNSRLVLGWCVAFAALAVIGFLTKTTVGLSRGWIALFFFVGLVAIIALNTALHRALGQLMAYGLLRRRRLMIIGAAADIARLEREIADGAACVYVAARAALPSNSADAPAFDEAIAAAVGNARALGIEDIIITDGLNKPELLERCLAAFHLLPVAIHVGAGGVIGRFRDARFARFGRASAVSLTRGPIGPNEAIAKRCFDFAAAGFALAFLAPLFAAIALAVRLDSHGPIFFRQRRRGYNLVEFQIWKFRTMTTLEDGADVRQATANDARVTAIGKFLRRYSLDELPQLINVLRGEMALVGPRPHAVAHDRFFETRLALYPRRLNMRPGITGWAQVNGFRGATSTDEHMGHRLEHDLFYIDNWSLALDFYILALTVLSPKAGHNAY